MEVHTEITDVGIIVELRVGGAYNPDILDDMTRRTVHILQEAGAFPTPVEPDDVDADGVFAPVTVKAKKSKRKH